MVFGKRLVAGRSKAVVFRIDDQRNACGQPKCQHACLFVFHGIVHHDHLNRTHRVCGANGGNGIETHPGGMVIDNDGQRCPVVGMPRLIHDLDFE